MEELNHDFDVPLAKLTAVKFDLMTSADMEKMSSISIIEQSDVTSPKLGLPNSSPQCDTCGSQNTRDCDGHFGVAKLAATVHNPYFINEVVQFLNQICPGCLKPKKAHNCNYLAHFDPCLGSEQFASPNIVFLFFLKRLERVPVQASCKYCSNDGAKNYPSVIFKALQSPRVLLSKSTLHRSPSEMERILIVAEAADRVSNRLKNKDSHEFLPQDYWDFVPSENQTQSNITKIVLSPCQ
ncbi:hypothetical protein EJB05_35129, partial [Eragrostis curvula]